MIIHSNSSLRSPLPPLQAETPTVPIGMTDYIGDLKLKAVKFQCSLSFVPGASGRGGKEDWKDMKVHHDFIKDNSVLRIFIQKNDGDSSWITNTDIYAKYRNGNWFGGW